MLRVIALQEDVIHFTRNFSASLQVIPTLFTLSVFPATTSLLIRLIILHSLSFYRHRLACEEASAQSSFFFLSNSPEPSFVICLSTPIEGSRKCSYTREVSLVICLRTTRLLFFIVLTTMPQHLSSIARCIALAKRMGQTTARNASNSTKLPLVSRDYAMAWMLIMLTLRPSHRRSFLASTKALQQSSWTIW